MAETESYFHAKGIDLPRKQICEIYMATGGVSKYLSYVSPGLSSAQVIHALCFTPQSPLLTEFHKLYRSLFRKAKIHLKIVEALAKKRRGIKRSELLKLTKLPSNGKTTEILRELEESGFILTIPELNKTKKDMFYYLYDEYTLFYLSWIAPEKSALLNGVEKDHWIKRQSAASWKSWSGFAFEALCFKHIKELKEHLRIGSVSTKAGYWKLSDNGKKVIEIDLVIDRADQCANLCEIKFSNELFVISKAYSDELRAKKIAFQKQNKKALFTTMITPHGVKENSAYFSCVDHQLTLDALF